MDNLTWKCHICGKKRPDQFIAVLTKPVVINGKIINSAKQNIRYCVDNKSCLEKAETFSFFK